GNAYVVGSSLSMNFPVLNALQATKRGEADAFVLKLDESGKLGFSTYLGGSGYDQANGIVFDRAGNICLVGDTSSTNFPAANALQSTNNGGMDAFVAKLNPAGNSLIFSTYLGGSKDERGNGIAIDGADNLYVTGGTLSKNFPIVNGIQ